ncbi:MAG: hypothetical protein CMG71_01380 [Candidatus Marinimicrobia bacterium]|nr:hypothetical protein [Candidatus Neomarinimicrobiota bacterium]|tara:strand:- start:4644 stop:6239 length:1596 start_codon:yes stop_codon:yes gene_type:complete
MNTLLSPFVISFFLTVSVSAILLKIGKNWLLDLPSDRKIHRQPIPRIGGLALGVAYMICLFLFGFAKDLWWYLGGAIPLFIMGAVDDHQSIQWPLKLIVELAVSSIIIFRFIGEVTSISFFASSLSFSTIGLIFVFLIWFVGILNAVNLIDGMDGLAGGFIFLVTVFAVIIGIVNENEQFLILNILLLGPIVGFLLFNRKPAKFFMGDSGSLLMGYHVACLPLLFYQLASEGNQLQITPFLVLSAFLIMDTTRVFISRVLRGQNPMSADTIHLHHLVYKQTNSYMGTLIPIFSVTLMTGLASVLYFVYGFGYLAMQLFLLVLIIFVLTPPVPFYVPLASRLTHIIARLKTSRFSNKHLFRVRYIPIFGLIYLIILGLQVSDFPEFDKLPVELLIGALFIVFAFTNRKQEEAVQTGVILFGVLQVMLFSQNGALGYDTTWGVVRVACLVGMVIVAAANYVENSRHLGFEFWSALDLLILLVYGGLIILKFNGIPIPILKWTEVVLLYYCLGLYAQHRSPRVPWKSLGVGAAR